MPARVMSMIMTCCGLRPGPMNCSFSTPPGQTCYWPTWWDAEMVHHAHHFVQEPCMFFREHGWYYGLPHWSANFDQHFAIRSVIICLMWLCSCSLSSSNMGEAYFFGLLLKKRWFVRAGRYTKIGNPAKTLRESYHLPHWTYDCDHKVKWGKEYIIWIMVSASTIKIK